ncbi:MAG: ATP-binding protein [Candidatus Omnitrophica bacterium]|nr:ATP-binding protein [Candidatus Omnitrophota bacterium]
MRKFFEPCLRNLQDKRLLFGLEEWDIFIVLGVGLSLQLFNVQSYIIWIGIGLTAGFLYFFKKGRPQKAINHFIDWYTGVKKYAAVAQSDLTRIKGRNLDLRLSSFQKVLPYSHLENEFLVMHDDSISVGYVLGTPVIDNFSHEDLIEYSGHIATCLNTLPENTTYQLFFTVDSNYHEKIREHERISDDARTLVRFMHQERMNRLDHLLKHKQLKRHQCYLFVNMAVKKAKPFWWFTPIQKINATRSKEMERAKRDFRMLLRSIEDGVHDAGMHIEQLDNNALLGIIYKVLNPDRVKQGIESPRLRDNELFVKQVSCSDFYIDEHKGEYLQYGGMFHKYLTLKILPEATQPAMLYALKSLPFSEYDVIVNFEAPAKEWGRAKIKTLHQQEHGYLSKANQVLNTDAKVKIDQYELLLEELQQQSQKLFKMQLTVHVYGEELNEVKTKTADIIRTFASMHGAEMHNERWGAVFPIFISALPGWTKESARWLLLKTLHLADLVPLCSDFTGSGKGECVFFNATDGIASYDPFYERLAAFNSIVVGATGSGKSFTINQIINQYSKNNPIEIFIDIGGSYKRQVLLKGGDYITLGLKEKFTINLFDLSEGKTLSEFNEEEQNEALILKSKTIEQMIGGTERFGEADQIVQDYIFRSVSKVFALYNHPVLSNFLEALEQGASVSKHFEAYYERVVGLLGNWVQGGRFGRYTDGPSTISLDNNIICFDLKGLSQFERLQSVMLTIVTNVVWGKIMSEPGRRKIVVFDECWKLLDDPAAAVFISECYRTFRKYGAGAISITQSLNDFIGGKLEDAIIGNSHTRFILKQNSAKAIDTIVRYFNLNEQEKALIESLHIRKGEYSQVFFSQSVNMRNSGSKIIIVPTALEYWVATTDAMDLHYYEEIKRLNPDMSVYDVLKICALDYPHGVDYARERSKYNDAMERKTIDVAHDDARLVELCK